MSKFYNYVKKKKLRLIKNEKFNYKVIKKNI